MNEVPPADPSRRRFFKGAVPATALLGLPFSARAEAAPASSPARKAAPPVASFATGLKHPRAIASGPGGKVCIAGDSEIQVHDADGALLHTLRFDEPVVAVAMDRTARIFAGLVDHIEVYDAEGNRQALWAGPEAGCAIVSLAVAESGEVYATDGAKGVVWHFAPTGRLLGRLTHGGDAFTVPRDFFPVTVSHGRPVVAHVGRHRIETLGADGRIVSAWGQRSRDLAGFGGCCNPIALAAMPDGGFVTAEGGLPRVKRFDREGNFIAEIAGPEELEDNARASSENPADPGACHRGGLEVAADENGRVLVLDRASGEVKIFA